MILLIRINRVSSFNNSSIGYEVGQSWQSADFRFFQFGHYKPFLRAKTIKRDADLIHQIITVFLSVFPRDRYLDKVPVPVQNWHWMKWTSQYQHNKNHDEYFAVPIMGHSISIRTGVAERPQEMLYTIISNYYFYCFYSEAWSSHDRSVLFIKFLLKLP